TCQLSALGCCFSSRRRHTRSLRDWSSDVCSSDLVNFSDKLTIDISGGSQVTLTGQATDLTLSGSGGSIMHLGDLQANNATVDYRSEERRVGKEKTFEGWKGY